MVVSLTLTYDEFRVKYCADDWSDLRCESIWNILSNNGDIIRLENGCEAENDVEECMEHEIEKSVYYAIGDYEISKQEIAEADEETEEASDK